MFEKSNIMKYIYFWFCIGCPKNYVKLEQFCYAQMNVIKIKILLYASNWPIQTKQKQFKHIRDNVVLI
jgi:NDP-sugar pyrophosphorylase family protein